MSANSALGGSPACSVLGAPVGAERPGDSPMHWSRVVFIGLLLVALPLLADDIIVRRLYMQYVEPESTAGTIERVRRVVDAEYAPGKLNVLVIGDSRVGEGFSPHAANAAVAGRGINFVRLGLAGTTPRVWYYVLREVDPDRSRFAGIYLMTTSLNDDDASTFADRELDSAYLRPLLGWQDILEYPSSFRDPKLVSRARRDIALVGGAMRSDLLAFAEAPISRIKKVEVWNEGYPSWLREYKGRSERVPVLAELSWESAGTAITPQVRQELNGYLQQARKSAASGPSPDQASFAYRSRWFGAIVDPYRSTAVELGVFPIPRGPYHKEVGIPWHIAGSLQQLQRKGQLKVVAASGVDELEQPAYFFDSLHLNAAGREKFSRHLALAIASSLGAN